MEPNLEIVNQFKKKVKELKKHNNLYFNYDKPKISDANYDKLKQELLQLEKKYEFLRKLSLLKNLVGSTPGNKFKKIKHLRPMLSLSNAFNKKNINDFLKKIKK